MIYKIKHIYKKWIMCHSSVCSKPVSSLPSPTNCPLRMNQLNEPLNDEPVNFAAWRLLPWYNWLTKQFAGNCRILHFLRSCKCACFLKVMQGFISRISFGCRHHKLLTMFTFLHAVRALERNCLSWRGKQAEAGVSSLPWWSPLLAEPQPLSSPQLPCFLGRRVHAQCSQLPLGRSPVHSQREVDETSDRCPSTDLRYKDVEHWRIQPWTCFRSVSLRQR